MHLSTRIPIAGSPCAEERANQHALYWVNSSTAMVLADAESGILLDGNPAAERLTGYSREELAGLERAKLHPEAERGMLEEAYRMRSAEESACEGFHVLRKDGASVPIAILSSGQFESEGRLLAVYGLCDMAARERKEDRFLSQNWALAAYAGAAAALGAARSSKSLLQAVCEAVTQQSIYVLAWVSKAIDGESRGSRSVAAAGSAMDSLIDLHRSWSQDGPGGKGPLGVCMRTNRVQVIEDSEAIDISRPWLERARRAGIRSAVTVPLHFKDGARGAWVVCSARPQAFDAVAVELFRDLSNQIGGSLRALEGSGHRSTDLNALGKRQVQMADALDSITAAMMQAVDALGTGPTDKLHRMTETAHAIARELDVREG